MKKRLIASGVVFGVGFAIGLGLTWALLARKPAPEEGLPAVDGAEISRAGAATTAGAGLTDEPTPADLPEPGNLPRVDKKPIAQPSRPPKGETAGDPALTAPERPTLTKPEIDAQPTAPELKTPTEPIAADAAGAQPAPAASPVAPPGQEPGGEQVAVKTNAWWKGLVGTRVRIDLGRTKALSIRTGGLEDGEVLSWSARFGTKRKLGTLYNGDPNLATVLGVAVSSTGTPVAARVRTTAQGKEVTGVIALHTQGLKIRLHPVD